MRDEQGYKPGTKLYKISEDLETIIRYVVKRTRYVSSGLEYFLTLDIKGSPKYEFGDWVTVDVLDDYIKDELVAIQHLLDIFDQHEANIHKQRKYWKKRLNNLQLTKKRKILNT